MICTIVIDESEPKRPPQYVFIELFITAVTAGISRIYICFILNIKFFRLLTVVPVRYVLSIIIFYLMKYKDIEKITVNSIEPSGTKLFVSINHKSVLEYTGTIRGWGSYVWSIEKQRVLQHKWDGQAVLILTTSNIDETGYYILEI